MIEHSMPENAILAIWQSNREGKRVSVIETKETVSIHATRFETNETKRQALNALFDFVLRPSNRPSKRTGLVSTPEDNARLWGEAFIRCGRCKRAWNDWFAKNPVTVPHLDWVKKAVRFVFRKSLI